MGKLVKLPGLACPTVGQGGPRRHPATTRLKWSRDMNIAVMECYYLSKPVDESGRRGRGIDRECMLPGRKEVCQR